MKHIRLTREEQRIENALLRGEYVPVSKAKFNEIAQALARWRKNAAKEKAAVRYRSGKVTLSEAARQANLTVWEMERYLIERGHKSVYSETNLKQELRRLKR